MRLTDAIGRYVAYTYDGDHLVYVDQNGRGITRYTYDKKGYISAITDQNNKRYTENIFDSRGRVTGQNYPDKTSCSITYDDIAHCTTFFYPETGRTEKTYHDGRKLVTKIEYQDGTTEEYGYDEWQNCIYEKNRRDAVTRRTFTEDGHKIKEEFANGLAINYAYDGNGNCTKEWDNAGGCTRYRYDENGNLAEKSILCDAKHAHYKTLRYGYRRNGSLQWEEDAEGNRTEYYFSTLEDPEDSQFVPRVCISPQGYEFRHSYDKIGRRIRTETVQGITEYRYNGLHYVSSIKDPEGNVKREERDNLGNLIRKYSGRQSGGRTSSVGYSYRYDYLDRLIWVRENVALEKMTIVGQDIVGGLFAINIGKYQEGIKKVWYFAPDTLQWECMDMNYAEFIAWAIQGNTDEFYSSMRWKCWKEDCSKAEFDEMILLYPFLWSKECNLENAVKKVVSSDELIRMNSEFAQKFGYC